MFDKYISANRLLRAITARCNDALQVSSFDSHGYVEGTIADYIKRDVRDLLRIWPPELDNAYVKKIAEPFQSSNYDTNTFQTLISDLLPHVEDSLDDYYAARPAADLSSVLLDLLHPLILESSYEQFRSGRYRDAVLNSIVAIFDLIRRRSGVDKDGAQLVGDVFSLDNPKLIFSEIDTESGKNDQKGFIQILQGAYLGVRNPKAHSLASDLNQAKAAQYLVFASLLARRVSEAKVI